MTRRRKRNVRRAHVVSFLHARVCLLQVHAPWNPYAQFFVPLQYGRAYFRLSQRGERRDGREIGALTTCGQWLRDEAFAKLISTKSPLDACVCIAAVCGSARRHAAEEVYFASRAKGFLRALDAGVYDVTLVLVQFGRALGQVFLYFRFLG